MMKLFSVAKTVVAAWGSLVKKRPVVVNSTTGAVLCMSSDALAQYMEKKQSATVLGLHHQNQKTTQKKGRRDDPPREEPVVISKRRALSAAMIGAAFGGWVYPAAYARLDALWHGTHFAAVLQKSLVEIVTVGVFVNTISMASRGLLVGRKADDVLVHVGQEMPRVTVNDARFWLPYNLVAFSVIPAALRPTTTALMEATWQTYISLRSHDYAA